jgi:hypothetical protein
MNTHRLRHVNYYPPFTHYECADIVRVFTGATAVVVAAWLVLLASRRWDEDRRSASMFLGGYAFALLSESTATSVLTLGRPPTWWLIGGRIVVIVIAAIGCKVAVEEAKRGVWARRT